MVQPLARITSDHIPCKISIGTRIPRSNIFIFENFWLLLPGFFEIVTSCWQKPNQNPETTRYICSKLKSLRRDLKNWSKQLSNLNEAIDNSNKAIFFIDTLEDLRLLSRPEQNFRLILKRHMLNLLHYRSLYWRKRCTIDRVKFDDENSKYFHATATISYRKNHSSQLMALDGRIITDYGEKATTLWSAFKARMGITMMPRMDFNLGELI